MNSSLFIIILKYIEPLDKIGIHRESHLQFLDHFYQQKVFIASGPQIPRNGGIIIAKCTSKQDLEKILKDDPFSFHKLAKYQIYEFNPTKYSASFKTILEEIPCGKHAV